MSRSQLSSLAKLLAIVQVLSFCLTCILRWSERLTLSTLEISTMGYAFCAVLAYVMWWKKPCIKGEPTLIAMNICSPLYAQLYDSPGSFNRETQIRENENANLTGSTVGEESLSSSSVNVTMGSENQSHIRHAGEYRSSLEFSAEWGQVLQIFAWSIISLLHSIFYVLAWNTLLPTEIDRVIWKICTAMSITLGPVMVHVINILRRSRYEHSLLAPLGIKRRTIRTVYVTTACVFVLVRLCMITEVLRELLYLPPDAFMVASWSRYLPYFS